MVKRKKEIKKITQEQKEKLFHVLKCEIVKSIKYTYKDVEKEDLNIILDEIKNNYEILKEKIF